MTHTDSSPRPMYLWGTKRPKAREERKESRWIYRDACLSDQGIGQHLSRWQGQQSLSQVCSLAQGGRQTDRQSDSSVRGENRGGKGWGC